MYKQAVILLLMLFTASVSAALPARYMQTIENAAVWAQIGDKMVTVGNIRAGQIIAVEPTAASYYAFNFGFGKGFIDKGHLEPVQGRQKVEDGLGDLNKPLSNQNLNPLLLKRLYILRTDSLETMSRLVSNQPQG